MQYEPGEVWVYNSPSITILSHILLRATGMTPLAFAQEHLFSKLGIENVYWLTDPFGVECMSGALYLTPRDMAKIGHLMLMNGTWDGEQIVPEEWISCSTAQHSSQPYHPLFPDYGYLWWLSPELGCYSAQGRFGQRIFVLPQYDIVLSFTCQLNEYLIQPWDYFIEEFIIPAVLTDSPTTSTTTSTTTTGTTGGGQPSLLSVVAVGASITMVVAATVLVWKKSQ
jgi:CubicO group peptidase (beta-lactamase class C family)